MLHQNNLEVNIETRLDSRTINIWVCENGVGERHYISYDGEFLVKTTVKDHEFPEDGKVKPFLHLPVVFADRLFKAINEHNSKEGIKTRDQSLIEGKLQATELHLGDSRKHFDKVLDALIKLK